MQVQGEHSASCALASPTWPPYLKADRSVKVFGAAGLPMQEQPGPDACRVTIADTGQSFMCDRGMAILDAGLIAGIGLPHSCRGGACGTCKSEVLEGSVDHGWVLSFAITDEEKAAGKCLICQSKPTSATLVIRPDGAVAPAEEDVPAPLETSGLLVASDELTPSIRRLAVALPKDVRFRYSAGMHVEIDTPGVAKRRTYSIANPPGEDGLPPDGLLEFFVTRHEGGRASSWLHADLRVGQPLAIHGPYGNFRWLKDAKEVLCLAGGSGLAPILAVLREALAKGHADPVELILSVRDRSEVFALDACHALARRHPNFSYQVTLSRAAEADPATGWRCGRVSEWLADELPDLTDWHVLIAGPPTFVAAGVEMVQRLGATDQRILTDSFTPTLEA
jgi:ferredoxin-NADP reductase/ferredoxin